MSEALSGGELVVRSLAQHGVELVFGIPGTHNLPLYAHLEASGIRHVSPRHEQGGGYAADAYARVSGRPGVVVTTTGPAVTNVATAAAQAHSDSSPLLVIAPGMPRAHQAARSGHLHEMPDQAGAMRGAVGHSVRVMGHAELAAELAAAFIAFRTERPGARFVEVPLDLLAETAPVELPPLQHTGPPRPVPAALGAAVERLRGAQRPGIVAGGGAAGAAGELRALAERLGAPVITTVNGKGTLPEDHPLALGARINLPAARAWLEGCDVVVAVGTELAESDLWGPPLELGGALIRIDLDPRQAHMNHPAAVAVIGDATEALTLIAEALPGSANDAGRAAPVRAALDAEWAEGAAAYAPWLPALRAALPDDAVIAADNAMVAYHGAIGGLPVAHPRSLLFPTGFGTLGFAVPAAIGAALGAPERPVLALSGDGGLMFSVGELAAAAALGLPLPVVVFVNEGYGEIRNGMLDAGQPLVGVDLPVPDLPALACALGCRGTAVEDPDGLAAAVTDALAAPLPTLIAVPEG
jgi:thiamine pyrophosphate-dependent acetolactate synthase large subunit-like protein